MEKLLATENIKRYYYQKGVIAYSLQTDADLAVAIDILSKPSLYSHFFNKEFLIQ